MDRSVVDGNQPGHRLNVLLLIGNAMLQSAERCLTLVSVRRKVFLAKPFGDLGRRCITRFSANQCLTDTGCRPVLETWHGNLVSYKRLEQVLCLFR